MRVSELDCVVGCRRLVEREAIFAGASSGGVAVATVERARRRQMEPGSRCAAIFRGRRDRAISRGVYDDGWVERELGARRRD